MTPSPPDDLPIPARALVERELAQVPHSVVRAFLLATRGIIAGEAVSIEGGPEHVLRWVPRLPDMDECCLVTAVQYATHYNHVRNFMPFNVVLYRLREQIRRDLGEDYAGLSANQWNDQQTDVAAVLDLIDRTIAALPDDAASNLC